MDEHLVACGSKGGDRPGRVGEDKVEVGVGLGLRLVDETEGHVDNARRHLL